ncbi:MAG: hypothetical protein QG635_2448 [Bacteroidota bacterium]|nr:hypothetical protein [Bacteroidota bacterium]
MKSVLLNIDESVYSKLLKYIKSLPKDKVEIVILHSEDAEGIEFYSKVMAYSKALEDVNADENSVFEDYLTKKANKNIS